MEGFGGGHGMPDEDEWVAAVESQLASTPSHPFTPDVVANARARICVWEQDRAWLPKQEEPISVKAARQILAVVERG